MLRTLLVLGLPFANAAVFTDSTVWCLEVYETNEACTDTDTKPWLKLEFNTGNTCGLPVKVGINVYGIDGDNFYEVQNTTSFMYAHTGDTGTVSYIESHAASPSLTAGDCSTAANQWTQAIGACARESKPVAGSCGIDGAIQTVSGDSYCFAGDFLSLSACEWGAYGYSGKEKTAKGMYTMRDVNQNCAASTTITWVNNTHHQTEMLVGKANQPHLQVASNNLAYDCAGTSSNLNPETVQYHWCYAYTNYFGQAVYGKLYQGPCSNTKKNTVAPSTDASGDDYCVEVYTNIANGTACDPAASVTYNFTTKSKNCYEAPGLVDQMSDVLVTGAVKTKEPYNKTFAGLFERGQGQTSQWELKYGMGSSDTCNNAMAGNRYGLLKNQVVPWGTECLGLYKGTCDTRYTPKMETYCLVEFLRSGCMKKNEVARQTVTIDANRPKCVQQPNGATDVTGTNGTWIMVTPTTETVNEHGVDYNKMFWKMGATEAECNAVTLADSKEITGKCESHHKFHTGRTKSQKEIKAKENDGTLQDATTAYKLLKAACEDLPPMPLDDSGRLCKQEFQNKDCEKSDLPLREGELSMDSTGCQGLDGGKHGKFHDGAWQEGSSSDACEAATPKNVTVESCIAKDDGGFMKLTQRKCSNQLSQKWKTHNIGCPYVADTGSAEWQAMWKSNVSAEIRAEFEKSDFECGAADVHKNCQMESLSKCGNFTLGDKDDAMSSSDNNYDWDHGEKKKQNVKAMDVFKVNGVGSCSEQDDDPWWATSMEQKSRNGDRQVRIGQEDKDGEKYLKIWTRDDDGGDEDANPTAKLNAKELAFLGGNLPDARMFWAACKKACGDDWKAKDHNSWDGCTFPTAELKDDMSNMCKSFDWDKQDMRVMFGKDKNPDDWTCRLSDDTADKENECKNREKCEWNSGETTCEKKAAIRVHGNFGDDRKNADREDSDKKMGPRCTCKAGMARRDPLLNIGDKKNACVPAAQALPDVRNVDDPQTTFSLTFFDDSKGPCHARAKSTKVIQKPGNIGGDPVQNVGTCYPYENVGKEKGEVVSMGIKIVECHLGGMMKLDIWKESATCTGERSDNHIFEQREGCIQDSDVMFICNPASATHTTEKYEVSVAMKQIIEMLLTPSQQTAMASSPAVKRGLAKACSLRMSSTEAAAICSISQIIFKDGSRQLKEGNGEGRRVLTAEAVQMEYDAEVKFSGDSEAASKAAIGKAKVKATSSDASDLEAFKEQIQTSIANEVAQAELIGESDPVLDLPASEKMTTANLQTMVKDPVPLTAAQAAEFDTAQNNVAKKQVTAMDEISAVGGDDAGGMEATSSNAAQKTALVAGFMALSAVFLW